MVVNDGQELFGFILPNNFLCETHTDLKQHQDVFLGELFFFSSDPRLKTPFSIAQEKKTIVQHNCHKRQQLLLAHSYIISIIPIFCLNDQQ